jgi:multiple sugar transport system permease protein/putative aldouronate transport system permease protein
MGTVRAPSGAKVKVDTTWGDKLFLWFIYLFISVFTAICLLPFWMVIVDSFATEESLRTKGFHLFPTDFSVYAYKYLFSGKQVFQSYGITALVTGIGTMLALALSSSYGYVLAHRKVKYGQILSFLTYFTMLFGAGLVGFYILMSNWLHLKDTIWALILPYLLNPFFVFILVSFFRTLPYEINEAATVDGASEFRIFWQIILPISKPVLATVALFYALQYWNDWWLALLFIDDYKLHPLQIMIRQLVSNMNAQSYIGGASSTNYAVTVPTYGIQLATVCVTIGPIILLYPFLQRYYVKGLTIGSVKG